MIRKSLVLILVLCQYFEGVSQPVTLPKLPSYNDTAREYYLTFCEQYYSLLERYSRDEYYDFDSCIIDFRKYDLKGTRVNGEVKWELVSPKKHSELIVDYLFKYNKNDWKVFPRTTVIDDTAAFNKLNSKSKKPLLDTFNFNKTALIYNDVWVDCQGRFYYKVQYDKEENIIVCNLIKIYGGCRGMRPRDSWITIDKPRPDTKIVLREIWVN